MDPRPDQRVAELGEIALVRRLVERLGSPPASELWSGDDAAVIEAHGVRLLFTVDTLTEDIDFDRAYAAGADVGFKALAVNVSDVAAMGGRPSKAVVALTVPADTPVGFVDNVMTGLLEGARRWRVDLVGGDLGGGGEISVCVALLGAPVTTPALRSGAHPADAICVTGVLGGAAGGLAVLRSGREEPSAGDRELIGRHLRPEPRVDEGAILASAGCSAMIDISDGLAVDLWRLLESSDVGCEVDPALVPADPALAESGVVRDPTETAILGGEDFELLFTMEEARLEDARREVEATGTMVTRIGVVTDGDRTIGDRAVDEWRSKGWEHLSNS